MSFISISKNTTVSFVGDITQNYHLHKGATLTIDVSANPYCGYYGTIQGDGNVVYKISGIFNLGNSNGPAPNMTYTGTTSFIGMAYDSSVQMFQATALPPTSPISLANISFYISVNATIGGITGDDLSQILAKAPNITILIPTGNPAQFSGLIANDLISNVTITKQGDGVWDLSKTTIESFPSMNFEGNLPSIFFPNSWCNGVDCLQGTVCCNALCVNQTSCCNNIVCNPHEICCAGQCVFPNNCCNGILCEADQLCCGGKTCINFDQNCCNGTACKPGQAGCCGENYDQCLNPGQICCHGKICGPCEICINHTCVTACTNGQTCCSGTCSSNCCGGKLCSEGYTCINNICTQTCVDPSGCPNGYQCENGICTWCGDMCGY